MMTQDSFDGQGGTLTGRAPAARIFALVILSLVVLLGSLLAVRAIGQHDGNTPTARQSVDTTADSNAVLVVPKDEPKPKPKPAPQRKPQTTKAAPATASTLTQSSAASSSPPPATAVPPPAPVQSAPAPSPSPSPAPAPASTPKPKPKPKATAAATKKAPVQHTVVVTQ